MIFKEADQVFLHVPKQSQALSTRPLPTLSPRYYGPFKVLKQVGNVDYKLDLAITNRVHQVSHISYLHRCIYDENNVVDHGVLVKYDKPLVQPQEQERFLDHCDLQTGNHI